MVCNVCIHIRVRTFVRDRLTRELERNDRERGGERVVTVYIRYDYSIE